MCGSGATNGRSYMCYTSLPCAHLCPRDPNRTTALPRPEGRPLNAIIRGSSADAINEKYALKGWNSDRLKKLLKGNHQRTVGTKAALVARCVDMELHGALPHCAKCAKHGHTESVSPSEDGLGYKCDGYKDDVGKHDCVLGRNLKHTEVGNTCAGVHPCKRSNREAACSITSAAPSVTH